MEKDVIFFWIPKAAGTSVYNILVKHGCIEERWLEPLQPFENKGISTFGHVSIFDLIEKGIISKEYFDRSFKFCFVRNPYDRIVSLFFYLKKIGDEKVGELPDFKSFCKWLKDQEIAPVGLYNHKGLNQINPQKDWITDKEGKVVVDFIGKFENLREDFKKICDKIGIDEELPHLNSSKHKDYRDYYDDETKEIISEMYKEDIKLFGYEF